MKNLIFITWGLILCSCLTLTKQPRLYAKEKQRDRLHIDWNNVKHLKYSDGKTRIVMDFVENGKIKRVYLR